MTTLRKVVISLREMVYRLSSFGGLASDKGRSIASFNPTDAR